MICVHRGLWGPLPENSCAAIRAANPYDIIEIDAQIAEDGVPVTIHDATLTRTARSDARVADLDAATLTGHRLLTGMGDPGADRTDHRLPRLSDALQAAGPEAYFDVDVKFAAELDAVGAAIRAAGLNHMGSLKVDTRSRADIDALLALQSRHQIMVMAKVDLSLAEPGHMADLRDAGVAAAELTFATMDQVREACAMAGSTLACSTYTLNGVHCCGLSDAAALEAPDRVWGALLDAGVTILMTDEPAALARYLDARS